VNNGYSIEEEEEDDSVMVMDVELSRPVNQVVMGAALFSAIDGCIIRKSPQRVMRVIALGRKQLGGASCQKATLGRKSSTLVRSGNSGLLGPGK